MARTIEGGPVVGFQAWAVVVIKLVLQALADVRTGYDEALSQRDMRLNKLAENTGKAAERVDRAADKSSKAADKAATKANEAVDRANQ